jgi:hypothetical protein
MTKFKWLANLDVGYSDGGLWQSFRAKVNCNSLGFAPNDKPETGALSATYPTQAQRAGLNGAPQPSLPVQEAGSLLPYLATSKLAPLDDKGEGSARLSSRYGDGQSCRLAT